MDRIAVWSSLRKTDFGYIYVITTTSDRIRFPIFNDVILTCCFEITRKLHEVQEEKGNLTINRKNYRNARRRSHCYYGNGEQRNKYTVMHGRKTANLI